MGEQKAFLRILDANYNRSKEALRVCEDLSRFLMNSAPLSLAFKKSRHEITRLILRFPHSYSKLVSARNSAADVGRNRTLQDRVKIRWQDIMASNIQRAQEAVRVMEEVAKVLAPAQSDGFQKLRYRLYELERKTVQKF